MIHIHIHDFDTLRLAHTADAFERIATAKLLRFTRVNGTPCVECVQMKRAECDICPQRQRWPH